MKSTVYAHFSSLKLKGYRNFQTNAANVSFTHKSLEYWKKLENQRNFFDQIAKRLKVKNYKQWYTIDVSGVQSTLNDAGKKVLHEILLDSGGCTKLKKIELMIRKLLPNFDGKLS